MKGAETMPGVFALTRRKKSGVLRRLQDKVQDRAAQEADRRQFC
jgi:hypothetical protein